MLTTVWFTNRLDKMLKTQCALFFIIIVLVNTCFNEQIIGSSCTVEASGAPGTCRLITNCKQVRDEVLTLQRLPQTCSFRGTQPVVCCPKKPGDISKEKCKKYSSYAGNECEHKITKRIVGGEPVSRTEFPHMAALGFEKKNQISWECGGSIISEKYILTAANCVTNTRTGPPKMVRVGVTSLNDTDHVQYLKVSEVIPHPVYKIRDYYNDIALIKLEKSIEITAYARPACLYLNKQISGGKATATGWGVTESGTASNNLLKVTLDIVDHELCNMAYNKFKVGIKDDLQLCTKSSTSEAKDTCAGDSGGPLQIHHNGDEDIKCMYDIVGVISFGPKLCGNGTAPGVNTRISHYIEWIENTIWKL